MKILRYLFLLVSVCYFMILAISTSSRGALAMAGYPDEFDFAHFESLKLPSDEKAADAARYLNRKYPPGSDVWAGVNEIERAGAQCEKVNDRGEFYWCKYNISGLLTTTEWKIVFEFDPKTNKISNILVGRGITGL